MRKMYLITNRADCKQWQDLTVGRLVTFTAVKHGNLWSLYRKRGGYTYENADGEFIYSNSFENLLLYLGVSAPPQEGV